LNSLLSAKQLYSWIENKTNKTVKNNTRETRLKQSKNTQKHTQNTLIKTFKRKAATETSDRFSNRT